MESTILYSTLPASAFAPQSSWINNTGSAWAAVSDPQYTPHSTGLGSNQKLDSITASVTGRFVVVASTINYDSTLTFTTCGKISLNVDGLPVMPSMPQLIYESTAVESGGQGFAVVSYLYDTGVEGTHTVQVILATSTFTGIQYFDWIAGFSYTTAFTPVILMSINRFQLQGVAAGSPLVNAQLERSVLNTEYRLLVTRMREEYNLPVYFVQDAGGYSISYLNPGDLLHPTQYGHRYIANRIAHVLQKGEFPYLSSSLM